MTEGQWDGASFAEGQQGHEGHEGLGGAASLVEEIRLLVDMVVEHALPWLESVLAEGHGMSGADEQSPDGRSSPEEQGADSVCDWCPLCAVVALARGRRPELAVRVFDQAAQVIALLRAVLADRWEPGEGFHMPGFRPSAPENGSDALRRSGTAKAGGRVQHIPVRRRDDWDAGAG